MRKEEETTMRFLISHTFSVRSSADELLTAPDLHDEGKRLMEALLDLEACNPDVTDAATSTDADQGTVTVDLMVGADSLQAAVDMFLTIARTAIHAIGGVTEEWPAPENAEPTEIAEYAPLNMQVEYV